MHTSPFWWGSRDRRPQLGARTNVPSRTAARFAQRDLEGLPKGIGRTEQELANWYSGVNGYLRLAFAHRPNYVRVDVDDPASLRALERFCGFDPDQPYHWVPQNVNRRVSQVGR